MKIKKPYTISNVEKNRIRGLHESVKNKNLINEQQYMHYMCEAGTCQCVSTYGVPPTGQQYFSLQDCQTDTSNCCSQTGGQSGCMDPSLGGYDPQATTDCAGNPVPNPVGPFGDTGCCGMPGPQEFCCQGGVSGQYQCVPVPIGAGCSALGSSGPYPTMNACQTQSTNCSGGSGFTCNQTPGTQGQCIADPNGQFATLQDCMGQCGQNQWWCQQGIAGPVGCFQSPTNPGGTTTGPYQSQAHCSNLCSQPQNTWKCKNIGSHPKFGKKCTQVQPGQGNFPTKSDCEDAGCGPRRADVEYEKEFATSSTSPRRPRPDRERLNEQIELPSGWKMVSPEELDEENAMDDLYEVWLGHEDKVVLETPYRVKEKIYELPARFGNKRLTETEMVNMINNIIK